MGTVAEFVATAPTDRDYLRGIVLFGRNVASYKFALARSVLELAEEEREVVPLSELAVPFSRHLCSHLEHAPKQGTSPSSRFLEMCTRFNDGKIDESQLTDATVRLGFNNVIDAFHNLNGGDLPTRFFHDDRKATVPSIRITETAFDLAHTGASDLIQEIEARWSLVETAWDLGFARSIVEYDTTTGLLRPSARRRPITSARPALNGYQKGRCFYCYRPITITSGDPDLADVDHVFPHVLKMHGLQNADGAWNLVLACKDCNRGPSGKFDSTPHQVYVARLNRRNEYLIASHHPLRETLISQTGTSREARRTWLQHAFDLSNLASAGQMWSTVPLGDPTF